MFKNRKGDSRVLEAVCAMVPDIAAAAHDSEQNRRLDLELCDRLADAGVFRMFMPTTRGGENLTPLQVVRVVEELARADASAGWTALVATGYNAVLGLMKPQFIDEVVANSRDLRIRGGGSPKGRLVEVEGGCRVSGQWPIVSGSYRYDWVFAHALVYDGAKPRMAGGRPVMRFVAVKPEEARFLDTWYTVGMRASASHDFVLDDVFVPEHRIGRSFLDEPWHSNLEGPTHRLPFPMITAGQHTAVSTGCAMGALEDLAELSRTKRPAFRPDQKLIDDPVFGHRFGELLARLDAARCYVDTLMEDSWELACSGQTATHADVARVKSMTAKVSLDCIDIVNEAVTLAGASAIYSGNKLQQRWRDVRVAAAHIAAHRVGYEEFAAGYFREVTPVPRLPVKPAPESVSA